MPDFYAGPHFMTNIACVRGVGNGGASQKNTFLDNYMYPVNIHHQQCITFAAYPTPISKLPIHSI